MLQTLTSGGQTPHHLFFLGQYNILTRKKDATLQTVDARLLTDRQKHTHTDRHTDRHTDTHTDRHDRFYDSCPSPDGQL